MVQIKADVGAELAKYIDSLIDDEIILNRADAIRQIIVEHRDKLKVSKR